MPSTDPFITIFTAPKPFSDPHISLIQCNALLSWLQLGDEVSVMMVGDETGMADFAAEVGISYFADVERNSSGTPLVSSIFSVARQTSTSPLLAYLNADILLTPQFLEIASQVYCQVKQFLVVGQRYDMDVQLPLDFTPGWADRLTSQVQARGRLHPPAGSDYFIFPRSCFTHLPDFAIGRAGWDNWMIYDARCKHIPVIDASPSILVVHQEHDYAHLPGGQPHYRLPESSENTRLAGGRRAIFHLEDANYSFRDGKLERIPLHVKKLAREIEIYPLVNLHSEILSDLFFAIFHPIKAWKEFRGRLAYKLSHLKAANA